VHDCNEHTPDSASVIAARHLADEARRRRLPPDLVRRRRRPLVVPPLPAQRRPVDPSVADS
jgi:hypothetical protein